MGDKFNEKLTNLILDGELDEYISEKTARYFLNITFSNIFGYALTFLDKKIVDAKYREIVTMIT
jgi:hypothetical protein